MIKCKNCLYPESHAFGLTFHDGICSGCFTHNEKYELNWESRKEALLEKISLISKKNNSKYDCVIPYSGDAEDYHVVSLVLGMGLNPLMVSINDYFLNIYTNNIKNILLFYFDSNSILL